MKQSHVQNEPHQSAEHDDYERVVPRHDASEAVSPLRARVNAAQTGAVSLASDEFDLDIRLGGRGGAWVRHTTQQPMVAGGHGVNLPRDEFVHTMIGSTCETSLPDGTCHSCQDDTCLGDDTCGRTCHETCHGTCRTCLGEATCDASCQDTCTCATCAGQDTCNTCLGENTCDTCPGQNTCDGTCVTCPGQNTCGTCDTCNDTCVTCPGHHTCDDTCFRTCGDGHTCFDTCMGATCHGNTCHGPTCPMPM